MIKWQKQLENVFPIIITGSPNLSSSFASTKNTSWCLLNQPFTLQYKTKKNLKERKYDNKGENILPAELDSGPGIGSSYSRVQQKYTQLTTHPLK